MIGVELITVAGQLISLIKARHEHKEDIFATFVEPLYTETDKVIKDYLQVFINALESVKSTKTKLEQFLA